MNRQIDILKYTLLEIESLKAQLAQTLNADLTHNAVSIEIKSRIDNLRDHVCYTLQQSLLRQERKQAAKLRPMKVA